MGQLGRPPAALRRGLRLRTGVGMEAVLNFQPYTHRFQRALSIFDPKIHKQRFGCLYIVPLHKGDGHDGMSLFDINIVCTFLPELIRMRT